MNTETKKKRLSTAERRAKVVRTISAAQLRYTVPQLQVMLGMGNTHFWEEVGAGRLKLYRDGNRNYATRAEAERYERERREAAEAEVKRAPRAVPGKRGVQRQAPA